MQQPYVITIGRHTVAFHCDEAGRIWATVDGSAQREFSVLELGGVVRDLGTWLRDAAMRPNQPPPATLQ